MPKKLPKAPPGTWWNRGWLYARDPRDRKVKSLKTKVPKQADVLISKWKAEAFEREHFPERAASTRGATFTEAAEAFLAEKAHKKSIEDDRERLKKAAEHFGTRPLTDITRQEVVAFLGQLTTRGGEPVAPATRNRYRAVLRSMWHVAVQNGMAVTNVVATIPLLPEQNERDRIASQAEVDDLLEAADPEMRKLITVAFWTAMRLSEILGIQRKHISRKAKTIRLGKTKSGRKRTVPMAPAVLDALNGHTSFDLTAAQASQRFRNLTERLGIKDLRFHDLRHTACTNVRRAGVDVFTMASISGHETLDMLRRYMTITEADQLAAIQKVVGQD